MGKYSNYGGRQSAFEVLSKQFARLYGIPESTTIQIIRDAPSLNPEYLYEQVRKTPAWQAEYGGIMDEREKNGLPYMGEESIQNQRETYRSILSQLSISDERANSYMDNWISTGASPEEIGARVDLAVDWVDGQDHATLTWLRENYGVKKRDLVSYVLDNEGDRSVKWFQDQQAAAQIGGEAEMTGVDIGKKFAGALVDRGVTRDQARRAFEQADRADDILDRYAAFGGTDEFKQKQLAFLGAFDPASGTFSGGGLPGNKKQRARAKSAEARAARLIREDRARWNQETAGKSTIRGGTSGNAF